jgi:hypothetical protein
MKTLYSILLFISLAASALAQTAISGTVTQNNIAVSNGQVTFTLLGCSDPLVNSSSGVPAVQGYIFNLDVNGNFPTSSVTGNDIIYCQGQLGTTYYQLQTFNQAGGLLWNRYYRIIGPAWNIGTATVLTNFAVNNYVLTNPPGDQIISTPINNRLSIIGGPTLIDNLLLGQDPTLPAQAATKNYVDNALGEITINPATFAAKVNRTGDTMTGPLLLTGSPTQPLAAATKQYVDDSVATITSTLNSIPYSSLTGIVPTWNQNTAGDAAGLSGTPGIGQFWGYNGSGQGWYTPPSGGSGGGSTAGAILSYPAANVSQNITQINSGLNLTQSGGSAPFPALSIDVESTGKGYYENNGPWNTTVGEYINEFSNKPGINHAISGNFSNYTPGDTAFLYAYMQAYGGNYFGSDEAVQFITGQLFQTGLSTATIVTPTVGITTQYYANSSSGVDYIWNGGGGGASQFAGSGNLTLLSVGWNTSHPSPTTQTDYFYLYTPNPDGTVVVNTLIPVSVTGGSGIHNWSPADFGIVPVVAGQGLGFYVPSGEGQQGSSLDGYCLATTSGGSHFSGVPVPGTTYFVNDVDKGGDCQGSNLILYASLNAPAVGATNLASTHVLCAAHNNACFGQAAYGWAPKGMVLDIAASPLYAGSVTSQTTVLGDPLAYTMTGVTFPISTAWGTIISCSNPNANNNSQEYVSNVCTVATGTSVTPNSPNDFAVTTTPATNACVAGDYQEELAITSAPASVLGTQTITITSQYNWYQSAHSIIMQGGMCGKAAIQSSNLVGGSNYWPMANFTVGSTTANQVLLSNCLTGNGCFAPGNVPYAPTLNNAWLTRTSGVVSAQKNPFILNATSYVTGEPIIISGCTTNTDMNGAFNVGFSSRDNINPVLNWNQAGANETVDKTCSISTPLDQVSFDPAAFVISSPTDTQLILATNKVVWTPADTIQQAPASSYSSTGINLYMGQSTPGGNVGIKLEDDGPVPLDSMMLLRQTGGYGSVLGTPGSQAIHAIGNWNKDLNFDYRPANNGAIIYVGGSEVFGGTGKPYYLFEDNQSPINIQIDIPNSYVKFNNAISANAFSKFNEIGYGWDGFSDTDIPIITEMAASSPFVPSGVCSTSTTNQQLTTEWYLYGGGYSLYECSVGSWAKMYDLNPSTGALNFAASSTIGGKLPCLADGTNCLGGGGGGMTWPIGGAGIPNYSGSNSWGTSYSDTNLIPDSYVGGLAGTPNPGDVWGFDGTIQSWGTPYPGVTTDGSGGLNLSGNLHVNNVQTKGQLSSTGTYGYCDPSFIFCIATGFIGVGTQTETYIDSTGNFHLDTNTAGYASVYIDTLPNASVLATDSTGKIIAGSLGISAPSTSIVNDLTSFSNTTGSLKDSGINLPSSVIPITGTNFLQINSSGVIQGISGITAACPGITCAIQQLNQAPCPATTTLSAAINATQTLIPVSSTACLSPIGIVLVSSVDSGEWIAYSSISGGNLVVAQRGFWGSTPSSHVTVNSYVGQAIIAYSSSSSTEPYYWVIQDGITTFNYNATLSALHPSNATALTYYSAPSYYSGLITAKESFMFAGINSLYNDPTISFTSNPSVDSCATNENIWAGAATDYIWEMGKTNVGCTIGANGIPANSWFWNVNSPSSHFGAGAWLDQYYNFHINGALQAIGAASQFAAGTTINGKLPCLADGTNCPATITNIQLVMPTALLNANTCSSSTATTMPGVTTTTAFSFTPSTDASGVNGWGGIGGLSISPWPSTNTLNWKVCNLSAVSITPGALTMNVSAK